MYGGEQKVMNENIPPDINGVIDNAASLQVRNKLVLMLKVLWACPFKRVNIMRGLL